MDQNEKLTLIGFRTPESLRERIEAERIALDTSLQDLLRKMIEHYFVGRQTTPHPDLEQAADHAERFKLTSLWHTYIREMPTEKVELMANVMQLDLKHFRSSRIIKKKTGARPRPARRKTRTSDAKKS